MPGTFLAAYLDNRQEATLSTLEDSILANELLKQVEMNFGLMVWTGAPSELHSELTLGLDRRVAKSRSWPNTPAMFGNELPDCADAAPKTALCHFPQEQEITIDYADDATRTAPAGSDGRKRRFAYMTRDGWCCREIGRHDALRAAHRVPIMQPSPLKSFRRKEASG